MSRENGVYNKARRDRASVGSRNFRRKFLLQNNILTKIGWKYLSSNDNTVVASNITFFEKKAGFICSSDKYQPHTVPRGRFLDRKGSIKYKFCFAPKFPSIYINQECSMGVGSLQIFYLLNLNGGSVFGDFGDRLHYQNNPFLRHVSAEILPKNFRNLFIIVRICT